MFLTVVTSSRSAALGKGLTYEANDQSIRPGTAVRVPLRRGIIEGIVVEVMAKKLQTAFDLRSVKDVLGDSPLLTEAQIKTVRWMSEYYCCSLRQALQVWLPPPPWSRLLPKEVMMFRRAKNDLPRGKKAQAVMEFLSGKDWTQREEIMHETEASSSVIRRLLEQGYLSEERHFQNTNQRVNELAFGLENKPNLTPSQHSAYQAITSDPRPSLLFGITGSGKTEIYAALIADVIADKKQAILLVPEILLTEHIIDRFTRMLPRQRIAILHSRLKPRERKEEWKRIHRGDVSLVIGSRSALFAPLKNLGLVIIDEEHEWTYKNEQTPRYHARETAEELCRNAGAKLVLGSATPSLESWARTKPRCEDAETHACIPAEKNPLTSLRTSTRSHHFSRYHLARLPDRFGTGSLPSIAVIDLADTRFGSAYPFSQPLLDAIAERLRRKEQCVLFLNRRGAASALLCLECRRRVVSPESQLPFTVHHGSDGRPVLIDHSTGTRAPVPDVCPHCRSASLLEVGAGTQRLEAILRVKFPDARILRADSDTLQSPEHMRDLLGTMRERRADILLGTQSVVKGLDLPNVTLAAVLVADVGLSLPHFRAGERIFQLLTQLAGRSGRTRPGDVIIQTFRPNAAEVKRAAMHETEQYLEEELQLRRHAGYPPLTSMIRLIVRGTGAPERAALIRGQLIAANLQSAGDSKVSAGPTLFGAGKEWHVLLRGPDPRALLKGIGLEGIVVDIDPLETL